MSNLSSVTIDAGVLAVPVVNSAKSDAFKFVDTLLDLGKLLKEPWVKVYMSEQASESLVIDGLYPLRDKLKKLFLTHGIVEYDSETVARYAERFLELNPTFETYFQVKDVLLEDLKTDPDVFGLQPHENLQSDLRRCITLFAVLRKYCSQFLDGHSFMLREAPKQVIHVSAKIHDIEHFRDDIPAVPCLPELFEGNVLVCDDFRGLIDYLDESAMLAGATDNFGIKLAIRIALFKDAIAQGECPDWTEVIAPAIGSEFRVLCQQVCAGQRRSVPPKILRSIVETIKYRNLSAVHALRTRPGGNAPQKTRNRDKAWRRDIDYELHLHYWECVSRTFELASVVCHDDFSIPG